LTLNLSRLGLSDESLICLDAKPGTLKAGQADGLQPRTLEILKSLGVVDEILNEGCHMCEVAFWNPKENGEGIERTAFVPDVAVATRYQHEVTIHQGRIERILEENLRLYSERSIVRSTRFLGFHLDHVADPDFPLSVEVEQTNDHGSTSRKHLRSKYLVGADGAHSRVRQAMDLKLEGETTDHIWGVVDFIADSDFPDLRKRSAIHSAAGSIMVIPRERVVTGEYLTRLYVQIKEEVAPDTTDDTSAQAKKAREKRAAITLEYIFKQAERVMRTYKINVRENTVVDWWAAYQIGQRMTPRFSMKDENEIERVFIVGDGKLS
jgi:phenol 2-monooxygenase (NADPH)